MLTFSSLIGSMSFPQFCVAFGTLWLPGPGGEPSAYRRWDFWTGYEGEPGQLDVAFLLERVRVFYAPKARQKGLSELLSLYSVYVSFREPKSQTKVFSANKGAAEEFIEMRLVRKLEGFSEVYPEVPWPQWEIGRDFVRFPELGSEITAYSSDNSGARGGTPRLVIFDEAREYERKEFKAMMATITPSLGTHGQLAVISSGAPGSEFNGRVESMMARLPLEKPSVWVDPEEYPGSGRRRTGMIFLNDMLDPRHRVPGWREKTLMEEFAGDEVLFKAEHPLTIHDIFASHEGLVVSSWDKDRHVVELPVVWKPHHEFYIVYDHGSTESHPAVLLLAQYDPWLDFLYVFDEVFERAIELSVMGRKIVEKISDWRRRWREEGQTVSPAVRAYGDVAGRYGTRQVHEILREDTGIQFITVHKRDEAAQIELFKARFFRGTGPDRRGGIAFSPRCRGTIKQISELRYKEGKDVPEELENDGFDAGKYLNYIVHTRPPTPEPTWEEKHLARVAEWKRGASRPAAKVVDPSAALEKAMAGFMKCG